MMSTPHNSTRLSRARTIVTAITVTVFVGAANCRATDPVADSSPAGDAPALQPPSPNAPVDALIPWLLQEDAQLRGIPFSEVIFDATGKHVLAFNPKDETD